MKNFKDKKGFEMSINMLVYLILAVALIVGGIFVYIYLSGIDSGLISRIRNFFRFG